MSEKLPLSWKRQGQNLWEPGPTSGRLGAALGKTIHRHVDGFRAEDNLTGGYCPEFSCVTHEQCLVTGGAHGTQLGKCAKQTERPWKLFKTEGRAKDDDRLKTWHASAKLAMLGGVCNDVALHGWS